MSRWDVDAMDMQAGGLTPRFASMLSDVAQFDGTCFGVSYAEGVLMDPQQRMLLECAYTALASSTSCSLCMHSFPRRRSEVAGWVFVGVYPPDYNQLSMASCAASSMIYAATGGAASVVSGRLAYTF